MTNKMKNKQEINLLNALNYAKQMEIFQLKREILNIEEGFLNLKEAYYKKCREMEK